MAMGKTGMAECKDVGDGGTRIEYAKLELSMFLLACPSTSECERRVEARGWRISIHGHARETRHTCAEDSGSTGSCANVSLFVLSTCKTVQRIALPMKCKISLLTHPHVWHAVCLVRAHEDPKPEEGE